ncbi:MAG: hypothetical protein LBP54_03240 [Campylobacteraceae bacterium]|nr:hypothetical protein [Campylobacteraceae bacterium]
MRDYDKNPIIIKNNYLLTKEIMDFVCFVCFAALPIFCLFYFYVVPEQLKHWGLMYIIPATIATFLLLCKTIMRFKKRGLFIKIYNNKITYDYLTRKHEFKTFTLPKEQIKSVKWGFFPHARLDKDDRIWEAEGTDNALNIAVAFLIWFIFLICTVYQLLYCAVNLKIEKYVLIRFKGGIMAIPKKEYPSHEEIKFEWNTIFNAQPYRGSYFDK